MTGVSCVFFSSRRRHTRFDCDWSSDVCSSDLLVEREGMDSLEKARDHIGEQIRLLKDAGVDFLILETFFHLAEMRVALEAAAASGLPVVATMSFRPLIAKCTDGHTPAECARAIAGLGAVAV